MTHRINHGWVPNRNDPEWESRVEREAQRITDATERAWMRAHDRVEKARDKARRAAEQHDHEQRVAKLRRELERRVQELAEIERGMKSAPASSQHRGIGAHRGVGIGTGLLAIHEEEIR